MSNLSLTKEQEGLFDYISSIIPENGYLVYDFTDTKQFDFANMLYELNGLDKTDYPGTYQLLADLKSHQEQFGYQPQGLTGNEDDPWTTAFDIIDVGRVQNNIRAAANGQGSVVGGFDSMTLALYVWDNVNSKILASGASQSFTPLNTLLVATDDAQAQQYSNNSIAYLHYSYQPATSASDNGNGPGKAGLVTKRSPDGPVADPVVTQPVQQCSNPHNPNAINIGLGRTWNDNNTDLDYWWNEPVSNNPIGKVPFVGNVVFTDSIVPLQPKTNFQVTITVTNTSSGGTAVLQPSVMDSVYAGFSIDPNNSLNLMWNLPAGTSQYPDGNPIVFSNIPWATDLLAYFVCDIMVTLSTNNTPAFATISSSNVSDEDQLDGTTYIPPLEFIWHCLADGTPIALADGSTKPVEKFVSGDMVQVAGGGTATVRATLRGVHHGNVIKLTVSNGASLITTHHHIFFTPDEAVPAHELRQGDTIRGKDGNLTIAATEVLKDYNGLFHNLVIDTSSQSNAESSSASNGFAQKGMGTFFANGMLTGDARAQRRLTEQRANDKEWVKAKLGDYWAKDVESHFSKK